MSETVVYTTNMYRRKYIVTKNYIRKLEKNVSCALYNAPQLPQRCCLCEILLKVMHNVY